MKKTITILVLCMLVALLPFQAMAEGANATEERILPFWDMSWNDMNALYASGATFKQETIYISVYKCFLSDMLMSGDAFSVTITPYSAYNPLDVWQAIGNQCVFHYDTMKQITPVSGSLAAYNFINEETYMRIDYMPWSSGNDRILIVCAKN